MSGDGVTDHDPRNVTDVTPEPSQPAQPMTPAERAKRYRQRRKASGNGTRPPFEPGNLLAVRHGAASPRFVDPLAAQIVADTLDDPDCPGHLRQGRYSAALAAWARAEACCLLIAEWLGSMDVVAALTAVSTSEESEERDGGSVSRSGTVRHVEGAMSALDRHQRTAARLRDALGLTPASAARLRLDVAPKFDLALAIAALPDDPEGDGDGR